MEKILIIGGCGYIGSKLFIYLSKKFKVDTVDLEWFGNRINTNNIKKNYKDLSKTFLGKYSTIILLAGHSSYYMCEEDIIGSFTNNVSNFVSLLDKISNQKLIYASSSSIYEDSNKMNITEKTKLYESTSHYALTKYEIDLHAKLSGRKYFGLRLGTINGISPNMRSDLVFHRFYLEARKAGTITVHNPTIIRPILGIEDFCSAIEAVITKKGNPGIYNLASFHSSIQHIAKVIAKNVKKAKIFTSHAFPANKSFSMNTKKFENEFNFHFKETAESIARSMKKLGMHTHTSERKHL